MTELQTADIGHSAAAPADECPAGECLVLQNPSMCLTMWPRMGGKILSLVVRRGDGDHELLHPPIHPYNTATDNSGFECSDAGGWDECLPSVAACRFGGTNVPDHGDLWRRAWQAVSADSVINSFVDAFSLPLHFSRSVSLHGSALEMQYAAKNVGKEPTEFLWSAHPLFQVDEGDRILLPADVATVHVEGSTVESLTTAGREIAWPAAEMAGERQMDLSKVGPIDGKTAHKLFAGPLVAGWCALYRVKLGLGILMRFDPARTPYAGLWISQGQWPAGSAQRQYTIALEPTTAPWDALDEAAAIGLSTQLAAGELLTWPLRLEVSGIDKRISYEDFLAIANASSPVAASSQSTKPAGSSTSGS